MRTRSTGLGKMELVSQVESLVVKDGYLVITTRSTAPVRWHVRAALSPEDARRFFRLALSLRFVLFLLASLFLRRRPGPVPDY